MCRGSYVGCLGKKCQRPVACLMLGLPDACLMLGLPDACLMLGFAMRLHQECLT